MIIAQAWCVNTKLEGSLKSPSFGVKGGEC